MSRAVLMAFAAGAAGVAGAWELLAALERARVVAWLEAAMRPLARARREGRLPSVPERRRLTLLASGCLLAAGWIVAGLAVGAAAAVGGPLASGALIASRRRGYQARLAGDAAGTARALAAGLAAGRSVRGAVAEAARGLDGPAGHELRRTAAALQAGAGTEEALEGLRARARSRAWDTLIAAILVQRDAGGDLPGLLRELAASQEAAARTDHDARAATAQARFTARLVAGLPAVALVLAELASPGFLAGLLTNPLSLVLLTLAAALQLSAFLAVRAISHRLAAP
ncbi:MAG: tight adherence protein [Solirubrobacteraceae bacterium]|nr:tight adherence protein [Solirubrobacteraceae bacterium]